MARIFTGGSADHVLTNERLDDFLFRHMEENGDKIFLTNATSHQQYSFRQVLDASRRLARGLQSRGFGKGDTITLYGFNSEQFVYVILACVHAGIVINTVNPAATVYELKHYFKEIQPTLIYTHNEFLKNVGSAIDVIKNKPFIFTRNKSEGYDNVADLCSMRDVENVKRYPQDVKNDVAFILFSSGTTGLPKGVMLTQYGVTGHLILRKIYASDPNISTAITVFPMYHGGGLFSGLLGCINCCINYIFFEKYNFELLLKTVQSYKPQGLLVPPPVLVMIAKSPLVDKYDVSSIKYSHTGAAPLKRETEQAYRERLNFPKTQQGYGMTEAVSGLIWTRYNRDPESLGSCGRPGIGLEVKITSPGSGEMLGPNMRGEIVVKSPTVMKGYLNRPEATKETIDPEGWLHTGDIGYFDDNGYLYIVDRLKELIKYKGNQVAPAELEALLLEHPDVADVGVVGVPSTEAGELPRAYVVKQAGSNISADEIHKFVNERVSYYKQLRGGVIFLKEIPKLPSGKILRRHLRELVNKDSKL